MSLDMAGAVHVQVRRQRDSVLLLLILLAAFCINLLIPRELWVQDEARYGEVLREMLQGDHWLVPHLNGYPYPDKPPLYFWIVAVFSAIFGTGEYAFRLVSIASTLLAAAGVYSVGRSISGPVTGFWSSAIFLTSFLTLIVGQIARMDMLLTASVVFAWYGLIRFRDSTNITGLLVFWLCTALGIAIKGPIALLFTLLPAVIWLWWEGGLKAVFSIRPLIGLLAIAAMVATWMVLVVTGGNEEYLLSIWHKQLLGRAVNSWSQKQPIYFYVLLAPILFMPWSSLYIKGLVDLARDRHACFRSIVTFSLVPLLAISLISGKLFIYMEPLLPAFSIAAGFCVHTLLRSGRTRAPLWLSIPPLLFVALLAAIVFWITHKHLGEQSFAGYAIACALMLLFAIGVYLAGRETQAWLHGWLLNSIAVSFLLFGGLMALLNPFFSAKPLGELVKQNSDNKTQVGVVNTTRGILNYYAGRTFTELHIAETRAWLKQYPQGVLILKTDDIRQVFGAAGIPEPCALHKTFTIELKEYHVFANCRS